MVQKGVSCVDSSPCIPAPSLSGDKGFLSVITFEGTGGPYRTAGNTLVAEEGGLVPS